MIRYLYGATEKFAEPDCVVNFERAVLCVAAVIAFFASSLIFVPQATSQPDTLMLEDFQSVSEGEVPSNWGYASRDGSLESMVPHMDQDQRFYVVEEGGDKFLRGETNDRRVRMSMATNGENGNTTWNLSEYPVLSWKWRAQELPPGAREDDEDLNDTGAAVYVTFETNWLGLPRSIKYTYSSTLPVGTVISFRGLRVVVVSTGRDGYKDEWVSVERDVVADYRRYFDRSAPTMPIGISVWTDSTETGTSSKADFGPIKALRTTSN